MGRRGRRRRRRRMKKKRKKEEEEEWSSSNWLLEADRRKRQIKKLQSESCLTLSPTDLRKKKILLLCLVLLLRWKKKKKWTECLWPLMHDSTSCLSTGDRRSNQRRRPGDSFPANAWFDFQTFSTGGCACLFFFFLFFFYCLWLIGLCARQECNYQRPQ